MEARAKTVSLDKLRSVVDSAVKAAAERNGLKIDGPNAIYPNWELIGRRLKTALNAQQFATAVTQDVGKATGMTLQPATLQVGKLIYVGFFDKLRVPIERGF